MYKRQALRNGALNLTASLGVAVRPPTRNRPLASLITDADEALYQAKRSGRDRTVVRIPDASSCPGRITKSFDINSGTFSAIN